MYWGIIEERRWSNASRPRPPGRVWFIHPHTYHGPINRCLQWVEGDTVHIYSCSWKLSNGGLKNYEEENIRCFRISPLSPGDREVVLVPSFFFLFFLLVQYYIHGQTHRLTRDFFGSYPNKLYHLYKYIKLFTI